MTKGHKRKSHEHRKDLAGEHRWSDIGQLIFFIIFIIGMIFDIFLLKISNSWQNLVPWYIRILIIIPLFFIAGYFAQNAHKKVFQEERKKLSVIKTGVFAKIRHPMYLGSILLYLCFVVLSFSIIAFIIFIIIVIFYYHICKYEEKLLVEKLGKEYIDYMEKVPMWIPFTKIKKK